MKRCKLILALLLILKSFGVLKAQNIESLLEQLEKYDNFYPQEKLYLQLDRYSYTAGERIWFKAYATIGISNFFSNHSGIAYVELIDSRDRKIDSLVIPLTMGIGWADISLADTITEGSYRVRAYTNWMRNSNPLYFYDRTIQITNARTDDILTSTVLREGEKSNSISIELKTITKKPIVQAKVNYELEYKGKIVEKKRGVTDDYGVLHIQIPKKYEQVQLLLKIQGEEKSSVQKSIKISNGENFNHVSLFPEGGKLLEGFTNTIGIKSINRRGLGQKVELVVMNRRDTVGRYQTNELGMGAFLLAVNPRDSIYVLADYGDSILYPVEMPQVFKQGYGIQANNHNSHKLFVQVNVTKDYVNDQYLYFMLHHLGKVLFVSKQRANKPEIVFSMDKKGLPSGVITISILNHKLEPVVERAIFSFNDSNLLSLGIDMNKETFGLRERVQVNMQVLGDDSLKVASLSASVINKSKIVDNPYLAPNILSGLLLHADLKGYIEKPGYYFQKDDFKSTDMDFLMLTQGWRNVNLKALDENILIRYEAEKNLSIAGYTKKIGRSKPEGGAKVQLISTKNFMDFIDTVSNEDGYFNFDKLLFPDSVKFLVTAQDAKGKRNIDITYNKPIFAPVSDNRNVVDEIWDVNSVYVDELKYAKDYFIQLESAGLKEKVIKIEEVTVRARQEPKVSKNSSNLNGPGNADQVLTAEELSTCPTLEICLSGRLLGVYWQAGVPYNTRGNVPMQVVLDGMFIEAEQISSINVLDIESIEVLRNVNYTAIYGSNGGNGLIVLTSKTGVSARTNYTPKGIITIQPQGLRVIKEFYKPKYEVGLSESYLKDLRTTIHWEPSIVTDMDGKVSFDFYTADEKGVYLLVIEGLDFYGKICRVIKEIVVE